jgi:hypothetical protein
MMLFILLSACGDDLAAPDAGLDASLDAATDAGTDAGQRACFHDVCSEGSYLEPGCDPCVAAVCENDDICCSLTWDETCVLATRGRPECSCREESDCGNLRDDDLDDDVDCADSGCSGDPICTPGDGPIGAPCTMHSDCRAAGGPPICRSQDSGFGGGSCSAFCDPLADDCGEGAVCLEEEIGWVPVGLCAPLCDPMDPASCRMGYACEERGEMVHVCVPRREVCFTPEDDDADGLVNCADRDCTFVPVCAENCDNGVDDTADGFVDCDDYTCLGHVECDDPICESIPAETESTCVVVRGFAMCNPVTNEGCGAGEVCDLSVGGYRCYPPAGSARMCEACVRHGCGVGTTCIGFGPPGPDPECWKFCCTDADCGEAGFCNKAITSQTIGIFSAIGVCAIDHR